MDYAVARQHRITNSIRRDRRVSIFKHCPLFHTSFALREEALSSMYEHTDFAFFLDLDNNDSSIPKHVLSCQHLLPQIQNFDIYINLTKYEYRRVMDSQVTKPNDITLDHFIGTLAASQWPREMFNICYKMPAQGIWELPQLEDYTMTSLEALRGLIGFRTLQVVIDTELYFDGEEDELEWVQELVKGVCLCLEPALGPAEVSDHLEYWCHLALDFEPRAFQETKQSQTIEAKQEMSWEEYKSSLR